MTIVATISAAASHQITDKQIMILNIVNCQVSSVKVSRVKCQLSSVNCQVVSTLVTDVLIIIPIINVQKNENSLFLQVSILMGSSDGKWSGSTTRLFPVRMDRPIYK